MLLSTVFPYQFNNKIVCEEMCKVFGRVTDDPSQLKLIVTMVDHFLQIKTIIVAAMYG